MEAGFIQGQLVVLTGIPQSRLGDYKRDKHRAAFASTLEKLADGLGMPHSL